MRTPTTKAKPESLKHSKLWEFFLDQLQDIYWAEKKLVKTLPKLADASNSDELAAAFTNHLKETKTHVTRLEQVFDLLGENAEAKECPALKGIAEEGEQIIDETDDGTAQRDVGLIFAGQKAEHYEIATYGGLIQLAKTMGRADVAAVLTQTLEEEKMADAKLTQIAESGTNELAGQEEEEE